jgi:hypothetical protein
MVCAIDRKLLLASRRALIVAAVSSRRGGVGQTGDGDIAATDLKRFMARQTFDAVFKLKLAPEVKLPPESWA